jgi:hypothetical protein
LDFSFFCLPGNVLLSGALAFGRRSSGSRPVEVGSQKPLLTFAYEHCNDQHAERWLRFREGTDFETLVGGLS